MELSEHRSRRRRASGPLRRLIAIVIAVDLLGGGALAYALTRPRRSLPPAPRGALTVLSGAIAPASTATQTPSPSARRRRPRGSLPPATEMSSPSMSRAPKLTHAQREFLRRSGGAGIPSSGGAATGASAASAASASFARFAATQPGEVGVAVAPLGVGSIATYGSLQVAEAWSTMKVPVLVTLLRDLERSGSAMSATEREDAALALTESDNDAADALFADLEATHGGLDGASRAVGGTLHAAADRAVSVNTLPNDQGFTTWGATQWSAPGEVTFYRTLARNCLLSRADTRYVLGLMGRVISGERWGAGSAGFATTPLMFKGGWGPEYPGYLARQTAIVGSGRRGLVFAILARPSDGSFAAATAMLTATAIWVRETFPVRASPAGGCP